MRKPYKPMPLPLDCIDWGSHVSLIAQTNAALAKYKHIDSCLIHELQKALSCTKHEICNTKLFEFHVCNTNRKSLTGCNSAYISPSYEPKTELWLTDELKIDCLLPLSIPQMQQEILATLARKGLKTPHCSEEAVK